MDLPDASELDAGHIIGMHFPSSTATWPHCALIIRKFLGDQRVSMLSMKAWEDQPDAGLFMVLMISHGTPKRGEMAEPIDIRTFAGTTLDTTRQLYMCYSHYDIAFLPGHQRVVAGAGGNYMGNAGAAVAKYYLAQLMAANRYRKNGGPRPPNIIMG